MRIDNEERIEAVAKLREAIRGVDIKLDKTLRKTLDSLVRGDSTKDQVDAFLDMVFKDHALEEKPKNAIKEGAKEIKSLSKDKVLFPSAKITQEDVSLLTQGLNPKLQALSKAIQEGGARATSYMSSINTSVANLKRSKTINRGTFKDLGKKLCHELIENGCFNQNTIAPVKSAFQAIVDEIEQFNGFSPEKGASR